MASASNRSSSRRRSTISSKWTKTVALNRHKYVRRHIPPTRKLHASSLTQFLNRYGFVYIKPEHGSHGRGVMKIERIGSHFLLQHTAGVKKFPSIAALRRQVNKMTAKEGFLIQKGIRMLRYNGRIYDMRIVTQRVQGSTWHLSGMLARVAKRSRIVTNGSQGATIHTLSQVLHTSEKSPSLLKTKSKLQNLSLSAAKQLHRTYSSLRELGFDIAFDQRKYPWILEVNTSPESIPFRKLANKSMYHTILRNRRKWGSRSTK